MRCAGTRRPRTALCLALLLMLAGCARPPWGGLVEGEHQGAAEQAFLDAGAAATCAPGWDGEVTVAWNSAAGAYIFDAYCQVLEPSYLKLVVANPLGQPVKAMATDGRSYQVIDALQQSSLSGSLRSWAAGHQLPPPLLDGPWLDWLLGRSTAGAERILTIRHDARARGVWVSIAEEGGPHPVEHLLFDPAAAAVRERIIVDDRGQALATIEYRDWLTAGGCRRPATVAISGLPYGSRAELHFSEVHAGEFSAGDFSLRVPPHFSRTEAP